MTYIGARNAYEFLSKQDVDMPPYEVFFQKVQTLFSDIGNSKTFRSFDPALSKSIHLSESAGSKLKSIDVSVSSPSKYTNCGLQKENPKSEIRNPKFKVGDMKDKVQTLLEEINVKISTETFKKLIDAWYRPFAGELDIYEDTERTLTALKQKGFRLAAITNSAWSGELIVGDLERFGIAHFFETVIVSSDIGYRKPDPVIFERALRELGMDASECIFVGDRLIEDIQGAQQVGMKAVLKGENRQKTAGIIPDAEIINLYEIIEVFDRITG